MDFLRWKKWYYKRALAAGTEDVNYIPGTTETDPALRSKFEAMVRDGMDAKELGLLDK